MANPMIIGIFFVFVLGMMFGSIQLLTADSWVNGSDYIYPNTSWSDNILVNGTANFTGTLYYGTGEVCSTDNGLCGGTSGGWQANSTHVFVNDSLENHTILFAQDIWMGYKKDGTPATLTLDAPSDGSIGQSGNLNYESTVGERSNTLLLESKGTDQSNSIAMTSFGPTAGTCVGMPSCIRNLCGKNICGQGCSQNVGGCTKLSFKCVQTNPCSSYTSQLICEFNNCVWSPGLDARSTTTYYTDSDTDATCYSDSDTDVNTYTGTDEGSYHINLSVGGVQTGYVTIEDDGTIDVNGLKTHASELTIDSTGNIITSGTLDAGTTTATTYTTAGGVFDVDDTYFNWDDGTAGIWADSAGFYADIITPFGYDDKTTFGASIWVNGNVTVNSPGSFPLTLIDTSTTGFPGFDTYYYALPEYTGYKLFYDTNLATVTLRSKYKHVNGQPWGNIYFEVSPQTQGVFENAMTIESTKEVGIGTTAPLAALHVNNTINNTKTILARNYLGSTENPLEVQNGAGTPLFYVSPSGITVSSSSANAANFYTSGQIYWSSKTILYSPSNGELAISNYAETDKVLLSVDNGELAINSSVGIGTTNPNATLDVNGTVNINGNLIVGGNVSIKRPYGMYSSTLNQTLAATGTAYNVSFNYTEDAYLITKTGDSNFTFQQTGDYLIELSAIAQSTTPGSRVEIWVRKNGVDIPRSNTIYDFKAANSNTVISVPFIIDMNTTDVMQIMWAGSNTGIRLVTYPPTAYSPETPSIIMTINKISELT